MKKLVTLLAMVMLIGCTKHYTAGIYPIPSEFLKTEFASKSTITLINDYGEKPYNVRMGVTDAYTYYGDLKQITEVSVTLLSEELAKRGMIVKTNGDKTIRLKVKNMFIVYHFYVFRATIVLSVEATNGYSREFAETNSSGLYQRSLDGAISRVIAAVLNDEDIVKYLVQGRE
jgi:uncharacterized lipoprotein YajG